MSSDYQSAATRDSNGLALAPALVAAAALPALALASLLAVELMSPATPPDRARSVGASASAPGRPVVTRPIGTWIDAALARPLFSPARRPPSTAVSPDAPLPRLAGTIKVGHEVVALFAPDAATRLVVVRQDADIAGWTVVDIANDAVVLARNGQRVRLGLAFADRPVSVQPLPASGSDVSR
jgi:hypothetical protein